MAFKPPGVQDFFLGGGEGVVHREPSSRTHGTDSPGHALTFIVLGQLLNCVVPENICNPPLEEFLVESPHPSRSSS